MRLKFIPLLVLSLTLATISFAQKKEKSEKSPLESLNISGLKWRNVGPALTSGRISDIAVHPEDPYIYYVATSSGGVWKTTNAGNTYKPIFDSQGSYSIGCVTIDPNNPNVIWVGTGENNNQRSVAYGDGVYKSEDGGATWTHVGLKNSEHIGKIIIHPDNSNTVYVAAIGPLWSKGGDRGLYKTTDGGSTWNLVLEIDAHTGVNDVVMDSRNPEMLYVSTLQRRRHVYTYVGGGPGSGIHKTNDGGATWTASKKGLPDVELGRIGLEISPANPEYIYAIVEAANGKGGVYRSTNRGASWEKRGSHVTSGNYYQEIIADTQDPETLYSMDTWMSVSYDGGKSFEVVGEDFKHVDNHSMWIDPNNNKHWLVGCDGGIYETFDAAANWDFKENLPITQFYKVAVDNAEPFYNIYGGTQDNFSLGGPSRVTNAHGITNFDWFITHGGDGFESQVDPENPNIVYAQSQYGWLVRYDKLSGEEVGIKPRARKGENAYRWNWDAPLAVSHHVSGRLYFAANKVFRSDDYGNSWSVISDDLSRQINRNALKVYDRVVSIDAVMKNGSTSPYGTIVALSESPLDADLIAIGTDDGLVQISENGGETWRKVDNIPGAPSQSYVNNIYLSQHDANRMYVAFNHHKYGDFKPYIFMSNDKGRSWKPIQSNLPERGSVYAIEEDHIAPGLIFCGTEFGAYFSPDNGQNWKALSSGLPTIAVRDIAIQRRENDLVLGTFGRGFYVLDDYSALRDIGTNAITENAVLYPVRKAKMWEQDLPLGLPGKAFQGDNFYTADNLGPVALITYYNSNDFESLEDQRRKKEKDFIKANKNTPYPSYDALKAEREETDKKLLFTITNADGVVVKKETRPMKKGVQRFEWNLRYEDMGPVSFSKPAFYNPFAGIKEGTLVLPGTYTLDLFSLQDDVVEKLAGPVSFEVEALNNTVMPAANRTEKVAFQREVADLQAAIQEGQRKISDMENRVKHMEAGVHLAEVPIQDLNRQLVQFKQALKSVREMMSGDATKRRLDMDQPPTPADRVGSVLYEQKYSTAAPTATHRRDIEIAKEEFAGIKGRIDQLFGTDLPALERLMKNAGVPYTPGRLLQTNKN